MENSGSNPEPCTQISPEKPDSNALAHTDEPLACDGVQQDAACRREEQVIEEAGVPLKKEVLTAEPNDAAITQTSPAVQEKASADSDQAGQARQIKAGEQPEKTLELDEEFKLEAREEEPIGQLPDDQSDDLFIAPFEESSQQPSEDQLEEPAEESSEEPAETAPFNPGTMGVAQRNELRRDIMRLAWPSVLELVLSSLAGMVDMMMVGHLGSYAITGIGLTNQPKFLILSGFIALNVGSTAMIARFKGMDDRRSANTVLRQSLMLTFAISAVLSVVGYVLSRDMVIWMGAEPDAVEAGTTYLRIQMAGLMTQTMTLAITAALRGAGNTKASMVINTANNISDLILNPIMIYGWFGFPRMGVAGASLSTVIGQGVACVMAFGFLLRGNQYVFVQRQQSWKPDLSMIKRMLKVGGPAMMEQMVMRVGLLTYTLVVAGLGTTAYATHQIAMNLLSLSFMNGQAFGIAATTLVGQSLGRNAPEDAWHYTNESRRMASYISMALAVVLFFFGKPLMSMYTKEADVIISGVLILQIIAFVQPFQGSFQVVAGALRGAGDTRMMAIMMGISIMIIRPIMALVMVKGLKWGLVGAWIPVFADQFLRYLLATLRFKSGKWTTIKV